MTEATPSSLHQKVAAILGQMSGVPKTGWNDFHKYAYVAEADVLDTLRPALAASNISVQVSITVVETKEVLQGTKLLTTVQGYICLTDAETGEVLNFGIAGQGMDNQDKGVPKAITMAVKYGLMKTFLLGSPDDAESNENTGRAMGVSPPPVAAVAAPSTSGALPTAPSSTPAPRAENVVAPEPYPWETPEEAAAAEAARQAAAAVPGPAIGGTPAPEPPSNATGKLISEAQGRLLFGRAKGKGVPDAERNAIIQRITGQSEINGVTWDKMDKILEAYDAYAAHHGTG